MTLSSKIVISSLKLKMCTCNHFFIITHNHIIDFFLTLHACACMHAFIDDVVFKPQIASINALSKHNHDALMMIIMMMPCSMKENKYELREYSCKKGWKKYQGKRKIYAFNLARAHAMSKWWRLTPSICTVMRCSMKRKLLSTWGDYDWLVLIWTLYYLQKVYVWQVVKWFLQSSQNVEHIKLR